MNIKENGKIDCFEDCSVQNPRMDYVINKDLDLSPNAPTVENESGGRQSHLPVRLDLIPASALLEVGKVLEAGAKKYGVDNWRLIECNDHLNHALTHIYAYLAGDKQDDHLSHAACRTLMALEMFISEKSATCKK